MQAVMQIIGGVEQVGEGAELSVVNPATPRPIAVLREASAAQVDAAVASAQAAFPAWSGLSPAERANLLWRWADRLEQDTERLARLESEQGGKPLKLAQYSDLPAAWDNLRFFAGAARHLAGQASAEYLTGYSSSIRREPVGVVASIAPWNYPILMAAWKLGPALAAGNTVVFKPAEETPLTAVEMVRLAREVGFPAGVLNLVHGTGEAVGSRLAAHPGVAMVSLTGSTATGARVMQAAAANVKRCHLELGGKAPFIVFADADLAAAVEGAACAMVVNTGQDCTAATRFFVQRPLYEPFLAALAARLAQVRLGDPLALTTDVGPLISARQLARVEGFVARAQAAGATLVCGGRRPAGLAGYYYEPTLLTGVSDEAEIMQQEVFGPVACVVPFDAEAEVIDRANAVAYGLAASVWTGAHRTALNVSRRLQFGTVWVNDHLPLTSEMPHGGFKQSGFGKDLSQYAFEEYTRIKHVMHELSGEARKGWHFTILGDVPQ